MAEQLRTLANLAEELALGPSIRMAAHNHPNSSFRGPDILFWPPRTSGMHTGSTYTYIHENTYTHKTQIIKKVIPTTEIALCLQFYKIKLAAII